MTQVIKIDKNKVRLLNSEMDQINDYIDLLNGIVYACYTFDEYKPGYRNTIAVDLTVGSYMLGLDAVDVMSDFIVNDLIVPSHDDEDPYDRVRRVLNYRYKFDWDWMLDPDGYLSYGDIYEGDIPLFFKLV